ncbi:MAG: ABC transporter ATP-binding protein, partial [Dysgonamonadaceae bacterium]|nr:ABC transporter ATP-binding protein [Dysgonamonadaceae bacterium]
MKEFLFLLKRFIPPYKKYLWLSIVMNVLSAVLNLMTFAIIKPILEMLFGVSNKEYVCMAFDFSSLDSWAHCIDILKNNFFWFMSQMVGAYNGRTALLLMAVYLVAATVLRTLAMYLSYFYMIPIRTGVVRD